MSWWPDAPTWRRCRLALTTLVLAALPASVLAQGLECDGTEGEREVRSLDFTGNEAFSDRDLALRVSTTPSDFLQRRLHIFGTRRCLDSDALRLDVGRLRVFYQRHGYYGATVDTAVVAEPPDGVRVTFRVEGARVVVVARVDDGAPIGASAAPAAGQEKGREEEDEATAHDVLA
jgi:hypothetical protein